MARFLAICLTLVLVSVAFVPQPVLAQSQRVLLTACNQTTFPIWVAVGEAEGEYYGSGRSKGWWKIEGGNCTYLGAYYTSGIGFNVYANATDGTYWGGSNSSVDDYYCIDPNNAFDLNDGWRGASDSPCPSGYTLKLFRFVHSPSDYNDDQDFSYTYNFHM